ncbi:hypothetical protein HWV62_45719 [Athelia sp. TMB]|nr:hypothetical protein HWV62_45719 [Athelia sp. TMB]
MVTLLRQDIASKVAGFTVTGTTAVELGLAKYLVRGDEHAGSTFNIKYNSQVVTKAALLERLATAVGCSPSDQFLTPRVQSTELIHGTLKPIVKHAPEWPTLLKRFGSHFATSRDHDEQSVPIVPPGSTSMTPLAITRTFSLLSRSRKRIAQADQLMAQSNLLLLAFMVFWHSTVPQHNTPIAFQSNDFFKELITMGERCGVTSFPADVIEAMTGADSDDLFNGLRNVVDVAVHISPLALLNGSPFTRLSIDRPSLVQWGKNLGPKPPYIQAAERKLWVAVMDIASGRGFDEVFGTFEEDSQPRGKSESILSMACWTDAPATDAPATDAPATDAPATDEFASGGPGPMDVEMSPPPARKRSLSILSDLSDLDGEGAPQAEKEAAIYPRLSSRVKKETHYYVAAPATSMRASKKRKRADGPTESTQADEPPRNLKQEIFWENRLNLVVNSENDVQIFEQASAQKKGVQKKNVKKNNPHPVVPMSLEKVDIKIFDETNLNSTPTVFTFQPDQSSAKFDIPLVRAVSHEIESQFDSNGRPPHMLPAASHVKFDNKASSIFRVEYSDLVGMDSRLIQEIFRDRHILVVNVPSAGVVRFDQEGFQMLSDIDNLVTVQCQFIPVTHAVGAKLISFFLRIKTTDSNRRANTNRDAMNVRAPFKTLLTHIGTTSTVALNVLDLPLGHANVPVPPKLHDLASEAYCANSARELVHVKDLSESTSWATAATKNALSWLHADDDGFATSVYVQAGHKIWVVARRKDRQGSRDEMANIDVFATWEPDKVDPKLWDLEARTCFGIVHSFVMGCAVTNTFHEDDTRSLLRQMMGAFYRHFVLHDGFAVTAPHIPDMRTHNGLFDVIVLGCVIELVAVLDRMRYVTGYREDTEEKLRDLEQESQARTFFRVIMKTFATQFFIRVGSELEHPALFWQRHLVRFAVVVVAHMKVQSKVVRKEPGLTAAAVEGRLRFYFQTDYPHLLPAFNAALENDQHSRELDWPGPQIRVMRRTDGSLPLMRMAGVKEYRSGAAWPLERASDTMIDGPVNKLYAGHWPHEDSEDDD